MTEAITSFSGQYEFLSNFFPVPIRFEGLIYDSVENAFQSAKTLDTDLRRQFLMVKPGTAKRMGRAIMELRPDWELVKVSIMEQLLRDKFCHAGLRSRLLATGDAQLIEGNTWNDRTWGAVADSKGVLRGQNLLGMLLMNVREDIRRATSVQP